MRRPSHRARLLLGAALAAVLSFAAPASGRAAPAAAASVASKETVLAALLVNFVRFTEWPDGVPAAVAPYSIGISGNRTVEDELLRLADHQLIRGHRLRVVRIKNVADLEGLHVAYLDSAADSQPDALNAADALLHLRSAPVLTVSDAPDFTGIGGMVRIFREDKALRFEIASDTTRASGLVLSSRLLALARIYRPAPAHADSRP